jgi:heme/copper-type cytochrome/quinol oxidase subunit 2
LPITDPKPVLLALDVADPVFEAAQEPVSEQVEAQEPPYDSPFNANNLYLVLLVVMSYIVVVAALLLCCVLKRRKQKLHQDKGATDDGDDKFIQY